MPQLDLLAFKSQITYIFVFISLLLLISVFFILPKIISSLKSRKLILKANK